MSLEGGQRTWIDAAGYRNRRTVEGVLMAASAGPFVWFFVHREFDTPGSRGAWLLFIVGGLAAKAWSAFGMRCRCCRLPIYLYWTLGFPKGRERHSFSSLSHCPYCGDDGAGETGNSGRVDPSGESRLVIRNVAFSALVLVAGCGAILGAMLYTHRYWGWGF